MVHEQVHLRASEQAMPAMDMDLAVVFGMAEFPLLFIAVFFAFKTSSALRGGSFGTGMAYIAWGFLVMAIGHLHMQIEHLYGMNVFNELLGPHFGQLAWLIALMATWLLSGLGFYSLYKSSRL